MEVDTIVRFIRRTSSLLGTVGGAVGLSGGLDSSVCAALISKALGPENCLGIIIPASDSDPQDEIDAVKVASHLGITTVTHPLMFGFKFEERNFETEVKPFLLKMDSLLPPQIELPYIMKLRGRMYIVTYYARKNNYFQCETLEKTEWMLGWFDKFGDGVGDIAPIRHLWKTEVYQLAADLSLPDSLFGRPAGSGNYPLNDLDELEGLNFEEVDRILDLMRFNPKNISRETGIAIDKVKKITHLVNISEPKRKIPYMR